MNTDQSRLILVAHLFPLLDIELIRLLRQLTPGEWQLPTIAKLWTVKDIASHLLDGNIKTLSFARDGYIPPLPNKIETNEQLVNFVNQSNADWVKAAAR